MCYTVSRPRWSNRTRAITYARVSTDAQERDGTSLDTQERACLDFACEQGWHVVESVRDAASGFSLDRPGIERVRQFLRAGAADVVIAYAVDRLSRNQNQIGVMFDEVQQAGARLEVVTERFEDTAVGRFILAARAFIAEVEREKIVERTMRGNWSGHGQDVSRRRSVVAATATRTTRPSGSVRSIRSRARSSGGSSPATPRRAVSTASASS